MKAPMLFVVGTLLLCTSTIAQSEEAFVLYEDIDFNADGWISLEEARQRDDLFLNWHDIDLDKDGLISSMEYLRYESEDRYGLPYEAQDMDPGAAPL